LGVGSFLFYVPINLLAKKFGKKELMLVAFGFFVLVYLMGSFLGNLPIDNTVQAYLLVALASIPMAVFGILPNAVVADIAEYDAQKTGVRREGMFFGVRTFMSKMGQMISMLILSGLLIGAGQGNTMGIRLTTIAAAVFCALGMALLLFYNEKKILNGLKRDA
jgi:GPH family glycoside/pentoside/hexuronide:cation symporter